VLRRSQSANCASSSVPAATANVRAKAGLNRGILDAAWGEFARQLTYKVQWRGGRVILVDAAYTRRTCRLCGHEAAEHCKTHNVARVACRQAENADVHAAKNILARGMQRWRQEEALAAGHAASACGGGGQSTARRKPRGRSPGEAGAHRSEGPGMSSSKATSRPKPAQLQESAVLRPGEDVKIRSPQITNRKSKPHGPFDRLRARRLQARIASLKPQVEAALRALQAIGVKAKVVGSYAEGRLGEQSHVDFLIDDRAEATMPQVYDAIASSLRNAEFDIVYWDMRSSPSKTWPLRA